LSAEEVSEVAAAEVKNDKSHDEDQEHDGAGYEHHSKEAGFVGWVLLEVAELLFEEFGKLLLHAGGKRFRVVLLVAHTGLDARDGDEVRWNRERLSRIMEGTWEWM